MGKQHPSINHSETRKIILPEAFVYGKYEFNDHWVTGAGVRKNLPLNDRKDYLSAQWNLNYSFLNNHSINLSAGRYHNYSLPNAEIQEITLFESNHASLDYKFNSSLLEFTSALFAKRTKFSNIEEEVSGIEVFTKAHLFRNRIILQGSYTLINAERQSRGLTYPTKYDLNYFVRGSLKYQHPGSSLDISLIMLYREGVYYRPVIDRTFNNNLGIYNPEFTSRNKMERLPDYFKVDLSVSKLWPISSELGIVSFFNISNLLNSKNIREKIYNYDYTETSDLLYSRRTVYFGGLIYF